MHGRTLSKSKANFSLKAGRWLGVNNHDEDEDDDNGADIGNNDDNDKPGSP